MLLFLSDCQLHNLRQDLRTSTKAAYAEGSRRNLKVQWESFLLFCTYFKFVSLPATTETLQLFSQFLSRTFKSTDSIKNYINGVKTMHLLLGFKVDHINNFILNLSVKGMAKLKPYCVRQAAPMTPEILIQIASVLDFKNPDSLVYWCLFLFAFFLLARKSNLVPTSSKDLKNRHFLLRKNVEDHKHFLIVNLNWTKTIQAGERLLQIPLVPIKESILCPVRAFKNMCKTIPTSDESPLFVLSNKKIVTYNMFQRKLRFLLHKVGYDPTKYSTHSFRRGSTTLLFKAEVPADKIQLMGDWRSDAYKKYLSYDLEDKLKISKIMSRHIQS